MVCKIGLCNDSCILYSKLYSLRAVPLNVFEDYMRLLVKIELICMCTCFLIELLRLMITMKVRQSIDIVKILVESVVSKLLEMEKCQRNSEPKL